MYGPETTSNRFASAWATKAYIGLYSLLEDRSVYFSVVFFELAAFACSTISSAYFSVSL